MVSNYPNGFASGVTLRGVPIVQTHPGKAFWVYNGTTGLMAGQRGGSNGNKGDFNSPFSTLEYALSQCVADRGDIIFIKPGHAESIASATALNFDLAGVAIVGLGVGTNRPTFTFTTANTATIPVTAGNMSIQNCLFIGNFLSIASAFTVAAGPNFAIENCEFRDTSAVLGFLSIVTTTVSVDANGLYVCNCKRDSDATTSPGPLVTIAGTITRCTISGNNLFHSVASTTAVVLTHGALVVDDLIMENNKVYCVNTANTADGILITTSATTGSGMISDNYIRSQDVAATILVTSTAVQYGMFNNLHTGETTLLSGFVLPAIGTDA
jgi:hypothetical protein